MLYSDHRFFQKINYGLKNFKVRIYCEAELRGMSVYNFNFTNVEFGADLFNFTGAYSPPGASSITAYFTEKQYPLIFHFAPTVIPPITLELLQYMGCQIWGQVYKYWVGYIRQGKQCFRRYIIPPDPKTPAQIAIRSKWAAGVHAWHALSPDEKIRWRDIGVRKLKPITSLNAFMSAWMKGTV